MWPIQRDQRVGMNDDLTAVRDVDHFAYFRRRGHATSAAGEFLAAGFGVTTGRRGFKTVVQAVRGESLDDDSVKRFLHEVVSIVERYGGEYDGWGAAVEAGDPI